MKPSPRVHKSFEENHRPTRVKLKTYTWRYTQRYTELRLRAQHQNLSQDNHTVKFADKKSIHMQRRREEKRRYLRSSGCKKGTQNHNLHRG